MTQLDDWFNIDGEDKTRWDMYQDYDPQPTDEKCPNCGSKLYVIFKGSTTTPEENISVLICKHCDYEEEE